MKHRLGMPALMPRLQELARIENSGVGTIDLLQKIITKIEQGVDYQAALLERDDQNLSLLDHAAAQGDPRFFLTIFNIMRETGVGDQDLIDYHHNSDSLLHHIGSGSRQPEIDFAAFFEIMQAEGEVELLKSLLLQRGRVNIRPLPHYILLLENPELFAVTYRMMRMAGIANNDIKDLLLAKIMDQGAPMSLLDIVTDKINVSFLFPVLNAMREAGISVGEVAALGNGKSLFHELISYNAIKSEADFFRIVDDIKTYGGDEFLNYFLFQRDTNNRTLLHYIYDAERSDLFRAISREMYSAAGASASEIMKALLLERNPNGFLIFHKAILQNHPHQLENVFDIFDAMNEVGIRGEAFVNALLENPVAGNASFIRRMGKIILSRIVAGEEFEVSESIAQNFSEAIHDMSDANKREVLQMLMRKTDPQNRERFFGRGEFFGRYSSIPGYPALDFPEQETIRFTQEIGNALDESNLTSRELARLYGIRPLSLFANSKAPLALEVMQRVELKAESDMESKSEDDSDELPPLEIAPEFANSRLVLSRVGEVDWQWEENISDEDLVEDQVWPFSTPYQNPKEFHSLIDEEEDYPAMPPVLIHRADESFEERKVSDEGEIHYSALSRQRPLPQNPYLDLVPEAAAAAVVDADYPQIELVPVPRAVPVPLAVPLAPALAPVVPEPNPNPAVRQGESLARQKAKDNKCCLVM